MIEDKSEVRIDRQFWFDLSKTLVEGIPERINQSVEQYEKLTLWLWGIYTPLVGIGSGTLAFLGNFSPSIWTMLLVLLPCVSLLFSYWFLSKAKSTVLLDFFADDPESIEREYNQSILTKNYYFEKAQKITLVTCALIPVAIFSYYLDKSILSVEKNHETKPSFVLKPSSQKNKIQMEASGFFLLASETELIHLKVYADGKEITLPFSAFPNPKDKAVSFEIEIPDNTHNVESSLEWNEKLDEKRVLFRKLEQKE